MAVAKTKTTTETEEPVEPVVEKVEPSEDAIVEKVMAKVRELLKGEPSVETGPEVEGEPTKPLGPRDEEARMFKVARAAVEEFKKSLGDKGEETETKAEPEKVPMAVAVRKIEKILWGTE